LSWSPGFSWGRVIFTVTSCGGRGGTPENTLFRIVTTDEHDWLPRRSHRSRGSGTDRRKGFTEAGYARLPGAAHPRHGDPLFPRWQWQVEAMPRHNARRAWSLIMFTCVPG